MHLSTDRSPLAAGSLAFLSALGVVLFSCGDDGDKAVGERTVTVSFIDAPATAAGHTALANVGFEARWADGKVAADITFDLAVEGGGSVDPIEVTTGTDGVARFNWTLGAMPIDNVLTIASELGAGAHTVKVDPAAALQSAPFGDVDAFIATRGSVGTTEDLAIRGGVITMAHGGSSPGLFTVGADGKAIAMPTTGEAFSNPLGLAYDHAGALYVADAGNKALMKVVAGAVTKLQDRDGLESFLTPNDVAVGPDGTVFLSDSCTGKFYAIHPTTGEVLGRIAFDPATEGGPNGVVVGPDGALWVTTENTAIFCGHDSVELTTPVAGLFRMPLGEAGSLFGAKEVIAAGVGVFGDGLAFDAHDNLYAIFDTVEGLALEESIVFVRRASGGPLVRAFAATGKVYANLAFGEGPLGATTMYLAMLKIALVAGSPRGLERIDVGVPGAPLPAP